MGRNHLDTLRDASLRYSTSNSIAPESPRVQPPQDFIDRVAPLHKDLLAVKVLWAGLKPSIRKMHNTAARSFEAFCSHYSVAPWPASFDFLSRVE
ncbi:hypothetical protein E4U35_004134 [Claviceps purpurea]|nr:hypothetical protein E4U35_004134 [Claviceps purpurea]